MHVIGDQITLNMFYSILLFSNVFSKTNINQVLQNIIFE
jgi:hypothetical protein